MESGICVSNTVRVFVFLGSLHGFAVVLLTDLSGLMASGVGLVARQCALLWMVVEPSADVTPTSHDSSAQNSMKGEPFVSPGFAQWLVSLVSLILLCLNVRLNNAASPCVVCGGNST